MSTQRLLTLYLRYGLHARSTQDIDLLGRELECDEHHEPDSLSCGDAGNGDPTEVEYRTILGNRSFSIAAYSSESVIAEKLDATIKTFRRRETVLPSEPRGLSDARWNSEEFSAYWSAFLRKTRQDRPAIANLR